MVKVECDGCKAPYQIDEKRIPPTGLKMRCPKCGASLLVMRPGAEAPAPPAAATADLPAPRAAQPPGPPPRPAAAPPKPPPRPAPPKAPPKAAPPPPPVEAPISETDFSSWDQEEEADLPNVAPAARKPAPPGARPAAAFGEIDLMVDLPAPAAFGESDLGSVDLPLVRSDAPRPGREAETDLHSAFAEVDLPIVHGGTDLPSALGGPSSTPAFGEVDLPAVGARRAGFGEVDLPAVGFGDIDLPTPGQFEAALPAAPARPPPAPRAAPKAPAFGQIEGFDDEGIRGFGEIDLPESVGDSALPAPAFGAGLPTASAGGLPMPATGFGLPTPAAGGLPMPATAQGLPIASGSGLPVSAVVDPPSPFGVSPRAATVSGPDFYAPSPMDAPPEADVGEELALGDEPSDAGPAPSPFDDSDRAVPMMDGNASSLSADDAIDLEGPVGRSAVGDEADLSGNDAALVGDRPAQQRAQRAPDSIAAPPKRTNTRKAALATAVLLALGGGALALEPSIGVFGSNFILDRLNAKTRAAELADLRQTVGTELDSDTAAAGARALERAKAANVAAPRYRPIAAYAAYVALARGLRFGRRNEDEAFAKQLLATAGSEQSDPLALALSAQDAAAGQLARARQSAGAIAQRAPNDLDAAVLAGEIELAAKAPEQAVTAWKRAVGIKKSARTLFGLARAELLAKNVAGAEAAAHAAITASPQHAAARTLLASLLWQAAGREAEALEALKQVTETGSVAKEASDAELVEAYTLLGRIHLARSRVAAAEQAFAAALKRDPQAVQALIGNGELFYRSGRFQEAQARYEAAIRADPDSVAAKVGVAKTWLSLERLKEAKDLLKKLREAHPNDPMVALWLGRAEKAVGNRKDAEAAFMDAIKVGGDRPEVIEAYVSLANLLSNVGRTDDANATLAEASQKFPGQASLHKARGEVALTSGRYEEAKREFEAALAIDDDLHTRFRLGGTLRRMRSFDQAMAMFDKIAAVEKDYPGLPLERGLAYEEMGQTDKALEAYREAQIKAPNDVDLKLHIGSTQVVGGHASQAEKILREVYKERPSSAEANHFLGRALLLKGTTLAEAMKYLEAAAAIDPNRAEFHLYVGWCANESGQAVRAETALKRALELDHELGDAYWQRGVLYQKLARTVDALADLQTALQKRPSRFEAYATMALCYQDQQKWAEAEQSWRKAIEKNDTVADWHFRLGKLLELHGSRAAAGPELEKAIALAEAPDQQQPQWLWDAHFLAGEVTRASDKEKAVRHYQRFLQIAPRGNPYVKDAENALRALGVVQKEP